MSALAQPRQSTGSTATTASATSFITDEVVDVAVPESGDYIRLTLTSGEDVTLFLKPYDKDDEEWVDTFNRKVVDLLDHYKIGNDPVEFLTQTVTAYKKDGHGYRLCRRKAQHSEEGYKKAVGMIAALRGQ